MKACSKCGVSKPPTEFYKNGRYRRGDCKTCVLEHRTQRYLTDEIMQARIKLRAGTMGRSYQLAHKYGISESEYEALAAAQGNRCAICGTAESRKGNGHLCVDHDHVLGTVRGLLCHRCNSALGLLQDDGELVQRAAEYLERRANVRCAS